jgi:hypothetical protein
MTCRLNLFGPQIDSRTPADYVYKKHSSEKQHAFPTNENGDVGIGQQKDPTKNEPRAVQMTT